MLELWDFTEYRIFIRIFPDIFLPACFFYAGNLAFVSKIAEAYTANAVFAQISVRSAADFATVVFAGGEFRFFAPFFD